MVTNADLELLSFFQTSELALHFNRMYENTPGCGETDFLYHYCSRYLREAPLSKPAETLFYQFVSKKNKAAFISGYRALRQKIYNVAALRYTLSFVSPENRLQALIEVIHQQPFKARLSIGDNHQHQPVKAGCNTQFYLRVNEVDFQTMQAWQEGGPLTVSFYVYWHSPEIFYWFKDALNAYGFVANPFPKYFKTTSPCRIDVEINDKQHQPLLDVGKRLAEQRFPALTKQLIQTTRC